MAGFLGEYEATIDAKGRFLLPGGIKKQLPEGTDTLILSRSFEGCLLLYTVKNWEGIEEKLKKLNDFSLKINKARTFLSNGTMVSFDTAGRILLPPTLKVYAKLEKDIMITGDIDKFKIWDSAKYTKLFEDLTEDDIEGLAEVMNNIPTL